MASALGWPLQLPRSLLLLNTTRRLQLVLLRMPCESLQVLFLLVVGVVFPLQQGEQVVGQVVGEVVVLGMHQDLLALLAGLQVPRPSLIPQVALLAALLAELAALRPLLLVPYPRLVC